MSCGRRDHALAACLTIRAAALCFLPTPTPWPPSLRALIWTALHASAASPASNLAVNLLRGQWRSRICDRVIRILMRIERDHPLRIAVRRHDDVGMPHRIVASLNPARPVAIVADSPLAPEVDEIDLRVPLPVAVTDRAFRIEGAVPRL